MPRRSASSMTALLKGCPDRASAAAARRTTSSAETPSTPTTSVTRGRPSVSVPVLSRTMALMREVCSSVAAFLIRMLCRAPSPVPTATAVGGARPRASGQAMTTAEMAKVSATSSDSPTTPYQMPKVMMPAPTARITRYCAQRSARRCPGALEACASSTSLTICASAVSSPAFVGLKATGPDLAGGNCPSRAGAHPPRLRRHQVEEGLQRVGGAAAGAHLHPVAEEDEGDQHRRRLVERLAGVERRDDAPEQGG